MRRPDLSRFLDPEDAPPVRVRGRITDLTGSVLRASLADSAVGQLVRIERTHGTGYVRALVVGFHDREAVLIPLDDVVGIGPGAEVEGELDAPGVRCGADLLGRVLDGLGEPMDGGPPLSGVPRPIRAAPPPPLDRARVSRPLPTGVRAIDAALSLGEGQRIGLFAGSGVGKSSLLGQMARGADADVVVIAPVGERGREVRGFLEETLEGARHKAVVVCATSDAPALVRLQAGYVATTIAEHFRDEGERVLLLLDSLTRLARAQREVGLAAGEPPVHRGYPASTFHLLPALLERAGCGRVGSITGIYTVLVAGDDMSDPVADEVRGILDGHIVLSRRLAERGHWPAVDVLGSLSRLMPQVTRVDHQRAAAALRRALAIYEEHRDFLSLGAYKPGANPELDDAVADWPQIEAFLTQALGDDEPWDQTVERLLDLYG